MSIIPSLPYNLQNGTEGDATQVQANFDEVVSDVNANAAANGANSDITSLSGLTTPLSIGQGGTSASTAAGARTALGLGTAAVENLGAAIVNDGSGNLTIGANAATNAMLAQMAAHTVKMNNTGSTANAIDGTVAQLVAMLGLAKGASVLTSSGTFTTASNTTSDTVFMFFLTGGGGGGGGASNGAGAGGGAATTALYIVTGLSALQACTVTLGASGSAGSNAGGTGGTGGASTIVVGATTVTAPGGLGGPGGSSSGAPTGGAGGGAATNATLSIYGGGGQAGMFNGFATGGGVGGASFWGGGGGSIGSGAGQNATAWGAGGGGAEQASSSQAGGIGQEGVLLAIWF